MHLGKACRQWVAKVWACRKVNHKVSSKVNQGAILKVRPFSRNLANHQWGKHRHQCRFSNLVHNQGQWDNRHKLKWAVLRALCRRLTANLYHNLLPDMIRAWKVNLRWGKPYHRLMPV